jgi:prephenate dehydrogenase
MTVDEHDKAMAVVQAAIHFQNYVTAHFLKRNSPRVKTQLGTILHTVLEKQLAQNPHMMAEIQTCNPHVRPAILNLKDSFDKMLDAVLAGDTQKVAQTVKSIAS